MSVYVWTSQNPKVVLSGVGPDTRINLKSENPIKKPGRSGPRILFGPRSFIFLYSSKRIGEQIYVFVSFIGA